MTRLSPLLLAFAAAAAQEPAPPAQEPPKQEPAQKPPQRAPAAARAPVANRPIDDVENYRDGQTAPVTRASSLFELDLSAVPLDADPVLLVEGGSIARADLDRQVGLLLGNNEIEQFITGVLLRRVKKEMEAAGQPLPKVEISEADVRKKFEEDKKLVAMQPGGAVADFEHQIREVFGWERYVEYQKQQLEFELFFFPDPPEDWAAKQRVEAKKLADEQERLEQEEARKEAEQAAGENRPPTKREKKPPPPPPADLSFIPARTWELLDPGLAQQMKNSYAYGNPVMPLFRTALMKTVRQKLLQDVELRLARPDEREAVIWCGEEPFPLRDLLALLAARADDHARRLALRELVNLRAADVRLESDGALLSEADADAGFSEFQNKFAGTIIPAEYAVTAFGFNSLWHYRGYFRCKHSYQKLIAARLDDSKLAAFYEQAGRVFVENGTCIAQVLFVPGERAAAKAEVDALLAEVAAGRSFAAVAREKGRFPDGGDVRGGAIAPLIRNKLRKALGENEYASFLSGYSFADEAFYAAREDSILGPVWRDLSPKLTGWMVLHVDRFFTTGSKSPFGDPKSRERALDDYADVTFPRYVNEALSRCRIEVPARPN